MGQGDDREPVQVDNSQRKILSGFSAARPRCYDGRLDLRQREFPRLVARAIHLAVQMRTSEPRSSMPSPRGRTCAGGRKTLFGMSLRIRRWVFEGRGNPMEVDGDLIELHAPGRFRH
jgi:hypothetical protein